MRSARGAGFLVKRASGAAGHRRRQKAEPIRLGRDFEPARDWPPVTPLPDTGRFDAVAGV